MRVFVRFQSEENTSYEWKIAKYIRRESSKDESDRIVVELSNGNIIQVNEKNDVLAANEHDDEALGKINDLNALCHLNEPAFVHYLEQRYLANHVYCRSGSVLIAVNPFQEIEGLYDIREFQTSISSSSPVSSCALPPHVFSIAELAYRSLRDGTNRRNQTVLVSGESGAGKTESTKFIMNYLAAISHQEHENKAKTSMETQALSANPILESFGNAKTLRNDNSSRFGKFVRLFFDENTRELIGMSTETYLLEKVRLVHQSKGERNFHIFYQLLAGASSSWREKLLLADVVTSSSSSLSQAFRYTNNSTEENKSQVEKDALQFEKVWKAMDVLGFKSFEKEGILNILSSLLHLGNVQFKEATEEEEEEDGRQTQQKSEQQQQETSTKACEFVDSRSKFHLEAVSKLLQVPNERLFFILRKRRICIGDECFETNLSQSQCDDARDAMARYFYDILFKWIVNKINLCSKGKSFEQTHPFIAVLDIFGFEEFERNSFEQFCINYANEKLQLQFIQHVMQKEQQEYQKEQIPWEFVTYQDNAKCLEVIENRPSGIWSLLDEECLVPKGKDATFARKLYTQLGHHDHFQASRKDQAENSFVILHYAGAVRYSTDGFCDKNRDQPKNELLEILALSNHSMIQKMYLFTTESEENESIQRSSSVSSSSRGRRSSVIGTLGIGSQFKQQLARLLETVEKTQTHYIRCIKPNVENAKNRFDASKVASQLRYGGVLKAVEILRQSFPIRMEHEYFMKRYQFLFEFQPKEQVEIGFFLQELKHFFLKKVLEKNEAKETIEAMFSSDIVLGQTKVFLRQQAFDWFEKYYENRRIKKSIQIQTRWRAFLERKTFLLQKKVLIQLQKRWKAIFLLKKLKKEDDAARKIQKWIRSCRNKRNLTRAACRIQKWYRAQASFLTLHRTNSVEYRERPSEFQLDLPPSPLPVIFRPNTNYTSSPSPHGYQQLGIRSRHGKKEASRVELSPVSHASKYSKYTSDQLLIKALDELEKQKKRAEAAEIALAQLTESSRTSDGNYRSLTECSDVSLDSQEINEYAPVDVHATDLYGRTALHRAIEQRSTEVAYLMIMNGADVNKPENRNSYSPLHLAVSLGLPEIVGLFLRPDVLPHVKLNAKDHEGNTPLHLAISLREDIAEGIVELLLTFGADPNQTNFFNRTPLHLCALSHGNSTLMKRLLHAKSDPNRIDLFKRTALHYCIEKELLKQSILLVEYGADMNLKDADGTRVMTNPVALSLLAYLQRPPSRIPDADVTKCMVCMETFGFFSKKNHCCRCERVCCSDCCPKSIHWKGRLCFDCKHFAMESCKSVK